MPKVDKNGKITIPKDIRDSFEMFPGMRVRVKTGYNGGYECINIIPYNYTCTECGAHIPDGTEYPRCEKCQKKYRHYVY